MLCIDSTVADAPIHEPTDSTLLGDSIRVLVRLQKYLSELRKTIRLQNMRQFYHLFPNRHAVRSELSCTHYRALMRVENIQAREWYVRKRAYQDTISFICETLSPSLAVDTRAGH